MSWLKSEICTREQDIRQQFRDFDPIARNLKKSGYTLSKKAKYLEGLAKHGKGITPRVKSFVVFPKKG